MAIIAQEKGGSNISLPELIAAEAKVSRLPADKKAVS